MSRRGASSSTRSVDWMRGALLLAGCAAAAAHAAPATLDARLQQQARRILGASQGVYVEAADGTVLVAQAATRAVHPASVSKVPTTLALLARFGPGHRFATVLRAGGPVRDGVLAGDLRVAGGGDPFLVEESALRIAQALRARGVARVAGGLRASGPLYFDWQREGAARRLRVALSGGADAAAWARMQPGAPTDEGTGPDAVATDEAAMPPAALPPMPAIAIDGDAVESPAEPSAESSADTSAEATAGPATGAPLLVYRSPPLLRMAKALNDYSNNVFAPFAEAAGGAASVEARARAALPAPMRAEVTLGDGAGADPANRLSPRAAVGLLRALEAELARTGHSLPDVLPVAGIDRGTLWKRLDGPGEAGHVVGKTGTFGNYGASALVGALRTREHGTVYFAILDHGVPVPRAREHQDAFVRALLARWHTEPWPYAPAAGAAWAEAQLDP